MTLHLIRHAQPNVADYDNRYPGPDLGAEGHRQAQWIADTLQSKGLAQIFASDYPRVLQTLQPFLEINPRLPIHTTKALWEREPTIETHQSLQTRVQEWFLQSLPEIKRMPTAIFAHCGPINMILEYLDPDKAHLNYPFTSPHGCHTPCAGIWEIQFTDTAIEGELFSCPI